MEAKKESWLSNFLETKLEQLVRKVFFWEKDDKRIGGFIRFLHHTSIYLFFIWYILIHTFMPSYFLFLLFYICVGLIWIHHCIVGGCLINRLECKLIGDNKSFVDPILETFHIPVTPESTDGFIILSSCALMFVLTFELINKTILNIRSWFSI